MAAARFLVPFLLAEGGRLAFGLVRHDGARGVEIEYGSPTKALSTSAGYDPFKDIYSNPAGTSASKGDWRPVLGPRGISGWLDRLLVWPEQKFAFCWVDKNAGTQFNYLMNTLNDINIGPWFQSNVYEQWLKHARPEWVNVSKVQRFNSVTHASGWKFGIFLRDPAERLLSVWSSKCQAWEDKGQHCLGYERAPPGSSDDAVLAFEKMVKEYLPQYMNELTRENFTKNAHYDMQSHFCGNKTLGEYDFVGIVDGDFPKVHKEVKHLFSKVARVPKSNSKFWEKFNGLFPPGAPSGHSSGTRSKMRTFYRDRKVYDAVVNAYEEDYRRLRLRPLEFEELQKRG